MAKTETEVIGQFQVDKHEDRFDPTNSLYSVYLITGNTVLVSHKNKQEAIKRLNDLRNEIYGIMERIFKDD